MFRKRSTRTLVTSKSMRESSRGMWIEGVHLVAASGQSAA
jgi:hypothetical protein